jgi:hypothetical protein
MLTGRMYWVRTIAFWAFTMVVVFEMAAGSLWDLLRIEYTRAIMTHLGYPVYLLSILGAWKLAGAATVLVPRCLRLKEWAYAGFVFNYTGAAASHLLAGDGPGMWAGPLVFAAFTVASWALRPADRRLVSTAPPVKPSPRAWAIAVGLLLLLLVISYFTLPKGPPPGYGPETARSG